MINEIVEIRRIGAGGNQHYNERSRLPGFVVALLHPFPDFLSIGRIAEHPTPAPILFQSVNFWREKVRALRVFSGGARI